MTSPTISPMSRTLPMLSALRRLLVLVALLLTVGVTAQAQNTRPALLQQATAAYDNFETARALDLARAALDPALGAPDSSWVRSLHLLAQVLFENGNEPDARTWARWGMRTNPGMVIDSVNFLAGVVGILRQARAEVGSRTASDELTRMVRVWPARGSNATTGLLRLDPSPMSDTLIVSVTSAQGTPVASLIAGPGLTLPAGSYEISVSARNFLPARITREVLPGSTLTLSFSLTPAAVLSGTITDAARQNVYRSTAALSIARFGAAAPACAAGVVTGGRFLLTSYSAIRGGDQLSLTIGGAPVTGDLRVAAYDVTSNLAVLYLPAARTDSVAISAQVIDGQAVWGVGLAQCRTLSDTRSTVDEWTQRPLGALRLGDAVAQGVPGAPVVDFQGRLTGLWTGGTNAAAAPNATALFATARTNVSAQSTLTIAEVARRESHAFGGVSVVADVAGAQVRLVGLERWHWGEITTGTTGASPFNFSGPMGRYRLETSAAGLPSRTQEIVVLPGQTIRVAVPLRTVAGGGGGQPQAAAKKGMPKWIWFAVIGGGAATAAAMGGGGGGGGGGPTTGSINISVPNP
jgi:hypothetical protein